MGDVFVVMRQLNMSILHSAGRIVDIEFCAVLNEWEFGTLKEGETIWNQVIAGRRWLWFTSVRMMEGKFTQRI